MGRPNKNEKKVKVTLYLQEDTCVLMKEVVKALNEENEKVTKGKKKATMSDYVETAIERSLHMDADKVKKALLKKLKE